MDLCRQYMISRTYTTSLSAAKSLVVEVEAELQEVRSYNDFRFEIIGLADVAIREAKHRVQSALTKIGVKLKGKVLINLAPAEFKKDGTSFDLAIAVSLLVILKVLPASLLKKTAFYGELALNGRVKPVKGVVAHLLAAQEAGFARVFIAYDDLSRAVLINDLELVPVRHLSDLNSYVQGEYVFESQDRQQENSRINVADFSDVIGQQVAKRAMLIAAAGGHHLLMVGPPGCGKSMLAARLPGILAPMSKNEIIETAKIYSFADEALDSVIVGQRPYRAPHHSISDIALVGGGTQLKAGEISMAHNGVLFLDELPEFRKNALEAIRTPLERGEVEIVRASGKAVYPCRFQLVAAMNPCPCGNLLAENVSTVQLYSQQKSCRCSHQQVAKYLGKLSQPILDRIDIQVRLDAVPFEQLEQKSGNTSKSKSCLFATSDYFRKCVQQVRQSSRKSQAVLNADLSNEELLKVEKSADASAYLSAFAAEQSFSARAYFRVLKVSKTIADLEGRQIELQHVKEACSYRSLDILKEYL